MTEKKRKRIVYAIFVLAVIYGLFNLPFGRQKAEYIYQEDDGYDQNEQAASATETKIAQVDIGGEWGNDPFARRAVQSSRPSGVSHNFRLTAISESNGEYGALINGKILSKGDTIEGWKLTAISRTGVTLSANGQTITLKLQGT